MPYKFFDLDSQYHLIKENLAQRFKAILEHKQFINGPEAAELEKKLEEYVGFSRFALATNSGTSALLLALMASGAGAGDEVITSPVSFCATALSIRFLGGAPVFADIEEETGLIKAASVEEALSDKTKAILPVSLYGQPADMGAINKTASEHGLKVIEDACQSFGAVYKGKKSGALSDFAAVSFFPAKPLGAYGCAGCVFTDSRESAEKIKQIRRQGQSERFVHEILGFNGLINSFQAAVLLEKLEIFEEEMRVRRKLIARYDEALKNMSPDLSVLTVKPDRAGIRSYYVVRSAKRSIIIERFKRAGRPLTIHYPIALFDQPALKGHGRIVGNPEKARRFVSEIFTLPLYPYLKEEEQERNIQILREALC